MKVPLYSKKFRFQEISGIQVYSGLELRVIGRVVSIVGFPLEQFEDLQATCQCKVNARSMQGSSKLCDDRHVVTRHASSDRLVIGVQVLFIYRQLQMPRRSTRLNVPSIVPESQLVTIGVNGADDEDEFVMAPKQPRQKRRKTSQINEKPKRTRGRRGILKQLTDVPLDVLFEVCIYNSNYCRNS